MEKGALIGWLVPLIIPVGLVGAVIGLTLAFMSVRRLRRATVFRLGSEVSSSATVKQRESGRIERVAVALCTLVGVVGAVATTANAIQGDRAPVFLFVGLIGGWALLGAPALMWSSRWRVPAEGVATTALAVLAILSGFSIGFAFVPVLVAMIWVCVLHLRAP